MAAPEVPIEVDRSTGRWSTDSLPMLYVPLHYFVNNHRAIEAEIGRERYAELLYHAGYQSAWTWCEHEQREHGISGVAVLEHYITRLSQRGWGLFALVDCDLTAATASIELTNSSFNDAAGLANEAGDYMFTGWFAGAMDQILDAQGSPFRTRARQVSLEGRNGAHRGLFMVTPA
ncbi:DUF5943 domain-containing protein [Rhodococcus koreensis]|uniref:DUF5943 domain-containing protein n=1 Tax=Rhodococcus koreensis TaxID=99653 RepID=UPI0036722708